MLRKHFSMGIIKLCTNLHPAPPTSTHLHSAPSTSSQLILTSTHLHPPPPSSFQCPLSPLSMLLINTINVIKTKILHVIWKFPQTSTEKLKVVRFNWNWHPGYLGGVDSKSDLRSFKFRSQNPFLGRCCLKKSKFSVFPENWPTWYLGGADSESGLRFAKSQA